MENHGNIVPLEREGIHRSSISYPHQVVNDPDIALEDKRAILSAWASDRYAVESLPALRHLPGTPFPVTFSSIMDARALLDRLSGANDDDPPRPRPMAKRAPMEPQMVQAA
ncbi:MAG TPA: hypothetical protein VFA87_06870 [Rhizomicrobium sp.]|nr:hypothetical protein [Rhizomicrobium sp.]